MWGKRLVTTSDIIAGLPEIFGYRQFLEMQYVIVKYRIEFMVSMSDINRIRSSSFHIHDTAWVFFCYILTYL